MGFRQFLSQLAANVLDGIEKGTVGAIVMMVCMVCIIILTATEGGSGTVENLLITAMVLATTLLGVNSVTDIFKKPPTGGTGTQKGS